MKDFVGNLLKNYPHGVVLLVSIIMFLMVGAFIAENSFVGGVLLVMLPLIITMLVASAMNHYFNAFRDEPLATFLGLFVLSFLISGILAAAWLS